MGEQRTLEGVADAAYQEAGLDADRPHVPRLARALLGPEAIQHGPRPIGAPAVLIRVHDKWRIVLSRSMPPVFAHWSIAHELGHFLLRRGGYIGDDEERDADYLAGALLAPRRAFISVRRAVGEDFHALAVAFGMTDTAAALRLGEVLLVPLAVVAPAKVRVRGPDEWAWPDESTLRRWARSGAPGIRKTVLVDDPRRVVLDATADE